MKKPSNDKKDLVQSLGFLFAFLAFIIACVQLGMLYNQKNFNFISYMAGFQLYLILIALSIMLLHLCNVYK